MRLFIKALRARRHFTIESFAIAKYPVTYAQYRAFLEAEDGYWNKQWWEGLYHHPEPGRQFMQRDNHPADNISWFDAMAFCRWLSAHLGYEVHLPTEWLWQQAARGSDPGNAYPWGPESDKRRANTNGSGLSRATAVGMYPGGASALGVLDLAGTVWEWCLNKYGQPQDTGLTQYDNLRVVRGGSCRTGPELARATYRTFYNPNYRNYDLGFRVCRSSCISSVV